jgi:predicted component of type VI protein secretion system
MTARVRARWALCALVVASCGAAPPKPTPTPKEPPLHLEITAGKDTNHGGPLYVVVRKLEQAGFLADDYDAIADKLFVEPRDPSVLRKAIVRPGNVVTVEADRALADGEILGIYFLFSAPGDAWRLAVLDKKIRRVNIVLGAAGIVSAEQK